MRFSFETFTYRTRGREKAVRAYMSSTSRLGVLGEAARAAQACRLQCHRCQDLCPPLQEGAIPSWRGCKGLHAYRKQTAAVTDLHLAATGDLDLCDHLVDMPTVLMHTKDCNWLFSTCPPQRSHGRVRPINTYFNRPQH